MQQQNEQYDGRDFFYHLEICCRIVAEKFGKAEIESWSNSDYIRLSDVLFKQTDVQISSSTLKRIFGKLKTTERYYPQKATRDALVQFVGFKDWEIFVLKHPIHLQKEKFRETDNTKPAELISIPDTTPAIRSRSNKRWLWTLIVLPVAALLFIIWQKQKKVYPDRISPGQAQLICLKPEGSSPHSAQFKIQLSKKFPGDPEKFTIDFGDWRNWVYLRKSEAGIKPKGVVSHYYEVPGRYYAILKYAGIPVDTVPIYLETNSGWTATAVMVQDSTRVYPVVADLIKNGTMQVTATELLHAGIDTNHTFLVFFTNVRPLKINGDNFELSANITTSQLRPGIRCSQINIDVYGERSWHSAALMRPGCEIHTYQIFSEVFKDGRIDDLSSVGIDISNGALVKLSIVNKKASLMVNEKTVFETTYKVSLGKIYGVRFTFGGIGKVNNFYLKDLKSGEVFSEGFTKPNN